MTHPRPDAHHQAADRIGRNILTVGQLRDLLADVDPDMHVVMDDRQDWYLNIGAVIVPGSDPETAEWACVTFVAGDAFDSRQF